LGPDILDAIALIGGAAAEMKESLPFCRGERSPFASARTGYERIAAESATRKESGFVHDNLWGVCRNFRHI